MNPFSCTVCSLQVLLSRKAEPPVQRMALMADEHGQAALIQAHSYLHTLSCWSDLPALTAGSGQSPSSPNLGAQGLIRNVVD